MKDHLDKVRSLIRMYGFSKAVHHAPAHLKPYFLHWHTVSERSGAMVPSLYPEYTDEESTLTKKQQKHRKSRNKLAVASRKTNRKRRS